MNDIAVILKDHPGSLAQMGKVLGDAGVSLEGGGVFVQSGIGIAHFLVVDGEKARHVLNAHGFAVTEVNSVLIQRLKQDVPGQLGKICQIMADHGINIRVQYSDHNNQLILVVDDYEKGMAVSTNWRNGKYD